MNNVLTASRMNSLLRCPRSHFWQYEIGLRKQATGVALRFGSAWARGMEARWNGDDYETALAIAIPEGVDLDAYTCSTVAALLAGYYDYYGAIENVGKLNPEVQFHSALTSDFRFTCEGKIDGLGTLKTGRSVLIEAKTTGDSLDPDSDYWLRLRFNMQVLNYVVEARAQGWDIAEVYYDVTRKPSIKPKTVDNLDKDGKKIVVDAQGVRIFNSKGKFKGDPKQSADAAKGQFLKQHIETPDEYCDRLWRDTVARPSFYFCRREVPIIDQELDTFERQRLSLVAMIEHFRSQENCAPCACQRDADAWPRNVSCDTCDLCQYKSFCLQNLSVDVNRPPDGFAVEAFNPELDKNYDTAQTNDATA